MTGKGSTSNQSCLITVAFDCLGSRNFQWNDCGHFLSSPFHVSNEAGPLVCSYGNQTQRTYGGDLNDRYGDLYRGASLSHRISSPELLKWCYLVAPACPLDSV
ncbi:hypothetical protein NPIL_489961 [Nephila pilipes]|uniref:Uncharacterized protein n=1 Tax=Nephila pilipes TaxID=299642 RepID=A0A8X6UDV8_NEPPI|nr:hypothetical protein NPIL_489961 [Nephila pilipes]